LCIRVGGYVCICGCVGGWVRPGSQDEELLTFATVAAPGRARGLPSLQSALVSLLSPTASTAAADAAAAGPPTLGTGAPTASETNAAPRGGLHRYASAVEVGAAARTRPISTAGPDAVIRSLTRAHQESVYVCVCVCVCVCEFVCVCLCLCVSRCVLCLCLCLCVSVCAVLVLVCECKCLCVCACACVCV
jgi:hypothetical protein